MKNRKFYQAPQPWSLYAYTAPSSLSPLWETVLPNVEYKLRPPFYCRASSMHRSIQTIRPALSFVSYSTLVHYRPPRTLAKATLWTSTLLSLHFYLLSPDYPRLTSRFDTTTIGSPPASVLPPQGRYTSPSQTLSATTPPKTMLATLTNSAPGPDFWNIHKSTEHVVSAMAQPGSFFSKICSPDSFPAFLLSACC